MNLFGETVQNYSRCRAAILVRTNVPEPLKVGSAIYIPAFKGAFLQRFSLDLRNRLCKGVRDSALSCGSLRTLLYRQLSGQKLKQKEELLVRRRTKL